MKYISKYSNGKTVSPAQYITEIICENKAKQDKKDLHYRFWNNPEWASFYRNQISTANKLVKEYNPQCIIRALKNPSASRIYSLRAPHLLPIIEQECKLFETENQTLTKDYDRKIDKKFNQSTNNKKSIISKLKELE